MTKHKSIFIKNIYYMLSYAFTVLQESTYEKIKKEQFDNINNLFAAIIAKGIGVQLNQGLYREYVNNVENLPVVRGKINMIGTIKNKLEHKMMITCDYDELSENNIFNQVIKSTAFLLLRQPDVDEEYKTQLKKEMLLFSNVSKINLKQVTWSDIHFKRNNKTYQLLIALCQMLIEGSLLTTENGEYYLASFLDERRMSRLFEKFILEYYKQEFEQRVSGFSSRALQIPWALDDRNDALLPVMQTDITLIYMDQFLIIDTKYYDKTMHMHFNARKLHSDNLYQIFTYVKNKAVSLNGQNVSGMLLYAKTDEDLLPDNVYYMSGNRISVKTLDLNQDFSKIAAQLNQIVFEHFGIS